MRPSDGSRHFSRVATVAPQSAVRANAQYDAAATPMFACFQREPVMTPYTVLMPEIDGLQLLTKIEQMLPGVPAVRDGRIAILVGDEFVVPGPRLAYAAERLARALHPGAF